MATILTGKAGVFGIPSDGTASFDAAAVMTGHWTSQDIAHEYEVKRLTDGDGKVVGLAAPNGTITVKLTVIVTDATSIATAQGKLALVSRLEQCTLANFIPASLNHARWVCTTSKPTLVKEDFATFEVTLMCSDDDGVNLATAIS